MKRIRLYVLVLTFALLSASLVACSEKAAPYPGYSTPQATLQTFFSSAQRLDYQTTYACYYQRYHELVPEQEFVNHRKQASVLTAYRIDSIKVSGDSAVASATLTFAPKPGSKAKPKTVEVREDLVRQADSWKLRVW
jgi:hypothetical protein